MIRLWLTGLLRHRVGRLAGLAAGVAAVVALVTCLGGFITTAESTMTRRAASNVAVDWQVQLTAGADTAAATRIVASSPGVQRVLPVLYGRADALTSVTGATTQRTGAARVLGLADGYRAAFPKQIRLLAGSTSGAVVAQQTAANLHLSPGQQVTVEIGAVRRTVTVTGVVELPQADSLFQTVGAAPGAQPSAPPDNVLLTGIAEARALFAGTGGQLITQLHVGRDRVLAADPATAYVQVTGAANNVTARLAGAGIVGDDLGAALGAARSDAAYATVLFLFLGLPGAVLAAILTMTLAGASRRQRSRERDLLRLRGASRRDLTVLAAGEAGVVAVVGAVVGLAVAAAVDLLLLQVPAGSLLSPATGVWAAVAAAAGVLLAGVAVAAAGRLPAVGGRPVWRRLYLDVVLVAVGAVLTAATAQPGYTLVLAPEGVATITVDYWAFAGPALLWVGGGLLVMRLAGLGLTRQRQTRALVRPLVGPLAGLEAAMLQRRRDRIAPIVAILAATVAFGVSTSTFNATYQQQAEVDARLTNGADVRVTTAASGGRTVTATALTAVPGVDLVEPLQHRFAYVGSDLQDLYGIRPGSIGQATSLQDSFFSGGTADQILTRLSSQPDGILVSQETAKDYQLRLGDRLTLRLPDQRTGRQVPIRFRYVGQALEFPTAPRDSFLIANASYIVARTGSPDVNTYLISTGSASPTTVAAAIREAVGTAASVTPIGVTRSTIGSSLTSVDLTGLTRLELAFALLLASAASGLLLALSVQDRRRTFAVLRVLGARADQLARSVIAEAGLVLAAGLLYGVLLGLLLAGVITAVLTGVFDPPPDALRIPAGYLLTLAGLIGATTAVGAAAVLTRRSRPAVQILRR